MKKYRCSCLALLLLLTSPPSLVNIRIPPMRSKRNGSELPMSSGKRARRTEQDLHCCSVPEQQPMLLKCDRTASDRISAIAFAAYGEQQSFPIEDRICGKELPSADACLVRVEHLLNRECVGQGQCTINPRSLGDPCVGQGKVLAVRWECSSDSDDALSTARTLPSLPLTVDGNVIKDFLGSRVRLLGVNWSGAHNVHFVPAGLDMSPLRDIARHIRELGFNFVRLTFSTEMEIKNPIVEERKVAANPHLVGKHALDIFDEVINALSHEGILILIDNHLNSADWCCSHDDCNGLWFNADYTPADFISMWTRMAARYRDFPAVFAVGLKNEPRSIKNVHECKMDKYVVDNQTELKCQWSSGRSDLQYRSIMEQAGRAVLEQKPDVLVSVSGLDFGQHLEGVEVDPIRLPKEHLLYEAHEYAWYDRWERSSVDPNDYHAKLTTQWGYLLTKSIAPVLVSEFGMAHEFRDGHEGHWFDAWSAYVQARGPLGDQGGLDWAYWQLTGVQQGGRGRTEGARESYGIMNYCWTAPFSDSHFAAISSLMTDPGNFSQVDVW